MKRTTATVAAAAAVLAGSAAGCSSHPATHDDTAGAVQVARDYQQAVNSQQWQKMCQLQTPRYRGGTVAQCTAHNITHQATASPSPSPSDTIPQAINADGSTPTPIPRDTPSGPDRASIGPVTTGTPVPVPAAGQHPAGIGIMTSYTYVWPNETGTARMALRLVKQDSGGWLVDQYEEIAASDSAHGDPLQAALARE